MQELERLLLDAAMLLSMQREGQITQEEFERWRDRWLKEYATLIGETHSE
jgi:hypothetical protein